MTGKHICLIADGRRDMQSCLRAGSLAHDDPTRILMANLKYEPIRHNHKAFLEKASKREGFNQAYDALAIKYAIASQCWWLAPALA